VAYLISRSCAALGAAFRVTKDGRTVLRAGAGLYYDSSLSIATDILDGVG